jgi:Holliday junction resolvasome RuvABC endonuclease subunit
MKILALDLAGRTGWASGQPGEDPTFGSLNLREANLGSLFGVFAEWLEHKITSEAITVVVYEAPILPKMSRIETVQRLMGLAAVTQMMAWKLSLAVGTAQGSQIKKHFTGSGKAEKAEMVTTAYKYGWEVITDDEADACALWSLAVLRYSPQEGQRFVLGPMGATTLRDFNGRERLDATNG